MMNTRFKVALGAVLFSMVVTILAVTVVVVAARTNQNRSQLAGQVPTTISFQGFLTDTSGTPVDVPTKLQFDLFEDSSGGSAIWTETHNSVVVNDGYFTVQLGSVNPFSAADFTIPAGKATLYIQVSIVESGGGMVSLPRQPLASVPYAFLADSAAGAPWSGLTGVPSGFADNIDDVEFDHVVTVAMSGGQFTSIQEAIDSITDADAVNRYMVWVAPGTYYESVTLKPNIHLVGAGKWLTFIESDIGNPNIFPPTAATLKVTEQVDVRSLTVRNTGEGYRNVAILAPEDCASNTFNDVSALAGGLGDINFGIFIHGDGVNDGNTNVHLENVNGYAFQGSNANVGLEVQRRAWATVHGGNYGGYDGQWAVGIVSASEGSFVDLYGVRAEGVNGQDMAIGLDLYDQGSALVQRGNFEARDAVSTTMGINVSGASWLEAYNTRALGQNGQWNNGIFMNGSSAKLNGGSFQGEGGMATFGVYASGDDQRGSWMMATSIEATGTGGSDDNAGLWIENGAWASVNGGHLNAYQGEFARGIFAQGQDVHLELSGVAAEGADSNNHAFGLEIIENAYARVVGGSFEGRNGATGSTGINLWNRGNLEASSVNARGQVDTENPAFDSTYNHGLNVSNGSYATINDGTFHAWGGIESNGVGVYSEGEAKSELRVTGIDASAHSANYQNDGLRVDGGSWVSVNGGYVRGYNGDWARGVFANGPETYIELFGLTAEGADCNHIALGLDLIQGAGAKIAGGSFEGRNGISGTIGINLWQDAHLDATSVVGRGNVDSSDSAFDGTVNHGLSLSERSWATINEGTFIAWGGNESSGVNVTGGGVENSGSWMRITGLDATADGASFSNLGLRVQEGSWTSVNGGYARGYHGDWAVGVFGEGQNTYLELFGLTSEGADCTNIAYGLDLNNSTGTKVVGGSFEGRNGIAGTVGINLNGGAYIETTGAVAIGTVDTGDSVYNDSHNNGLAVRGGSSVVLNGGSYIGRGGVEAFGMFTEDNGVIEATSVSAIGEESPVSNNGVRVEQGGLASINGGRLLGRGGADNRGAYSLSNTPSMTSTLDLNQVTAHGDPGGTSIGVSNEGTSITSITGSEIYGETYSFKADGLFEAIRLSRLVGGAMFASGSPTCVAVTYNAPGDPGAFYADSCPIMP